MKPVLFKTEMTQAIISGRKSQTRRVIDIQSTAILEKVIHNGQKTIASFMTSQGEKSINCKFGTIGSRLWVKETFWSLCRIKTDFADAYMGLDENSYKTVHCGHYRFTKEETFEIEGFFWKKMSSLFMPKVASRIQLEIIDIRVERLLDITESDAKKEGVLGVGEWFMDYLHTKHHLESAKESFITLWDKVNGKGSHKSNPFVWVIEFKKL